MEQLRSPLQGSGIASRIVKWQSATGLTSSLLSDSVSGGTLTLSGTLTTNRTITIPDATGTLPLLSLAQTFSAQQTFSAGLLVSDGAVGAPSLSFASDTDTGFYRVSSNSLGLALGGLNSVTYGASTTTGTLATDTAAASYQFIVSRSRVTGTNGQVLASDRLGALRFQGQDDTGTVRNGAAIMAMAAENFVSGSAYGTFIDFYVTAIGSTALTQRLRLHNDGGMQLGTVSGTSPGLGVFQVGAGAAANPSLSFTGSTGMGFYRASADNLGISTAGTQWLNIGSTGIFTISRQSYAGLNTPSQLNASHNIHGIDGSDTALAASAYGNGSAATARLTGHVSQGTGAAPTATAAGDIVRMSFRGHTGSGFATADAGRFSLIAGSAHSLTSRETYAEVETCPSGSTSLAVRQRWYPDGGVQIGGTYGTSPGAGVLNLGATTASTSTTTGALTVAGGVGVLKAIYAGETIRSTGATHGIGYDTGAGGTVTQITSRTTGVTLNKVTGAITLVSAAGSVSWQSFTVTNSAVAATDTIICNQVSGTDLNMTHVTAVAAGSFRISFATTAGVTVEQPVFRFTVIKSVSA